MDGFAGKVRAYPNEAPFRLKSRVGTWPYPQTLGKDGIACQGQTHELRKKKSFISLELSLDIAHAALL